MRKFFVLLMMLVMAIAGASDLMQRARIRNARNPWKVSASPEIAMMS